MAKRVAHHIEKASDVEEIVNISYDDARSRETIMNYFGDFGNGPRFQVYDTIDIPTGKYGGKKKNKSKFRTTVGLWIFNKSFMEPICDGMPKEYWYVNQPINSDMIEDINQAISYAVLEDKLTVQQLKDFITQFEFMMGSCSTLANSHTDAIFDMQKDINKKKKELEKKYEKGLKENDLVTAAQFEKELIDFTKDYLKDDPAVDMFNSGARSSWGNNVKNMYICRGPQKGTDGSYKMVTSSLMDGMDPKDFATINDAAVGGPYSRARKTVDGGYKEKQFVNATQHIKVLPKGSDCGTKRTIKVTLTKKNIKDWMYSFVQEGSKTTEITTDTMDKFVGKTVNMRFSALCEYKKGGYICEKCMSALYNRIGVTNVGLTSMIMMSSLKNRAMKSFHDSSLKLSIINPDDAFSLT